MGSGVRSSSSRLRYLSLVIVDFYGPDRAYVAKNRHGGNNCDILLADPEFFSKIDSLVGWLF